MSIIIPDIETRNFGLREVIHRPQDVTSQDQVHIGLIAMGYVQGLRDYLWERFMYEIPLNIRSGLRGDLYNAEIGGKPDSFHKWRRDKAKPKKVIFALDLDSPEMTPYELYLALKDRVRGECYEHRPHKIVHIAPVGPDEEWVQK